jgi:hypothetical protein
VHEMEVKKEFLKKKFLKGRKKKRKDQMLT